MEEENKVQETQKSYTSEEKTKKCKHCQSDISMKAKICPVCKKRQKPSGCLTAILVVVGLFVILGIIGSFGDDSDKVEKTTTASTVNSDVKNEETADAKTEEVEKEEAEPTNEFNVGDIAETKNLKISYLSALDYESDNEYMQPKDGNKYVKCEFEFENIGDTDQYVTLWDFVCYSDGYASEQAYLEDDLLSATLSSGKKTKGYVYYEVPVSAQSVILEYETNFWSQNKIVFIVQ